MIPIILAFLFFNRIKVVWKTYKTIFNCAHKFLSCNKSTRDNSKLKYICVS